MTWALRSSAESKNPTTLSFFKRSLSSFSFSAMIVEAGKRRRREYTAGLMFGREEIHFALFRAAESIVAVIPGRRASRFALGYSISRRWRDDEPSLTVGLLPRPRFK